jgi:hypothetical protein
VTTTNFAATPYGSITSNWSGTGITTGCGVNTGSLAIGSNTNTWLYAPVGYAGTSTSVTGGGSPGAISNLVINTTMLSGVLESNFEYLAPAATRLEEAKSVRHSIEEFGKLGENWDGYGASSISNQTRENANHFVEMIEAARFNMPVPEVSPQPSGTISFEWETPSVEVYLEIGNTLYSGFIKTDDEQAFFLQGQAVSLDQQVVALMHRALSGPFAHSAPTITEIRARPQSYERRLAA